MVIVIDILVVSSPFIFIPSRNLDEFFTYNHILLLLLLFLFGGVLSSHPGS